MLPISMTEVLLLEAVGVGSPVLQSSEGQSLPHRRTVLIMRTMKCNGQPGKGLYSF